MEAHRKHARHAPAPSTRRAEKLSALATLLGPDAMERLRRADDGFDPADAEHSPADAGRVAWQRSRLLERLRERWTDEHGAPEPGTAPRTSSAGPASAPEIAESVGSRIASSVDLPSLADEHPAVIVHVLRQMGRRDRVAALRALPGPIARAAIHRLRSPR
jgi:hypothetical protein